MKDQLSRFTSNTRLIMLQAEPVEQVTLLFSSSISHSHNSPINIILTRSEMWFNSQLATPLRISLLTELNYPLLTLICKETTVTLLRPTVILSTLRRNIQESRFILTKFKLLLSSPLPFPLDNSQPQEILEIYTLTQE
jgi:hypothetical protein